MIHLMIDGVFSDTPPPIIRITGVAVDVKVWKIAATNIDTNPVIHRRTNWQMVLAESQSDISPPAPSASMSPTLPYNVHGGYLRIPGRRNPSDNRDLADKGRSVLRKKSVSGESDDTHKMTFMSPAILTVVGKWLSLED